MRRKPWARPELAVCPFFIEDGAERRGRWAQAFPRTQPLHLELGCGKGQFIGRYAARHPQINFIAVDIKSEVLAVAKRTAEQQYLDTGRPVDNLLLTAFDIERIDSIFCDEDRIERLYIQFCNPWPKLRAHKHRLTHSRQLKKYRSFLLPGARLEFKTDDVELFEATLCYLHESGFIPLEVIRDLPENHPASAVVSEHERMFREQGCPIGYICAAAPPGAK
jgi:tRNA (guanine-N7-)-methyltransferase